MIIPLIPEGILSTANHQSFPGQHLKKILSMFHMVTQSIRQLIFIVTYWVITIFPKIYTFNTVQITTGHFSFLGVKRKNTTSAGATLDYYQNFRSPESLLMINLAMNEDLVNTALEYNENF